MWERKQKTVGLISSTSSWLGVYRLLFCLFMATFFHQGVFGDRKMDEVAGGATAVSPDPPAFPTSAGPFLRASSLPSQPLIGLQGHSTPQLTLPALALTSPPHTHTPSEVAHGSSCESLSNDASPMRPMLYFYLAASSSFTLAWANSCKHL